MSKLESLTGRNYLSYSSLTSFIDCGERYRLEYVLGAPKVDAWYFIAGDSIHKATEDCDIAGVTEQGEAEMYFRTIWHDNLRKIEDESKVRAAGRQGSEGKEFWEKEGPASVWRWVQWRQQRFSEGWQFWQLPNGDPAIEVPVQVEFDDVLVKGYIDRVMVNDAGEALVVDLKSGSRTPQSTLQLGIYALGMARNFDIHPALGSYFMTRKGELTEPSSLLHYTHDLVGSWFKAAKTSIEAECFIPHVGMFCSSCTVAPYCAAVGGDPSKLIASKPPF